MNPLATDAKPAPHLPSGRRIVIAGGSGFLGQALAAALQARGDDIRILTRRVQPGLIGAPVLWDGARVGDWATALDGATAVVNFTGKSVDCRYTEANRREIVASRVNSVRAIGEAIRGCARPPGVWVQAGSLAIYGDAGPVVLDEDTPPASGFSAGVCRQWESAFADSDTPSTRKVFLRIGFALGAGGGALHALARLARLGLGGRIGDGRQYISWIHLDDLVRMVAAAIDAGDVTGVFNATGPSPVTNNEFMTALRRAVRRPWSPPVPRWAVRVGARLMRTEPELALSGRRCIPRAFTDRGFVFHFDQLETALADALKG